MSALGSRTRSPGSSSHAQRCRVALVAQEKTQKTILCTWLTEMYLEELANASAASGIAAIDAEKYHAIIKEFETFLKTYEVGCAACTRCARTGASFVYHGDTFVR